MAFFMFLLLAAFTMYINLNSGTGWLKVSSLWAMVLCWLICFVLAIRAIGMF